MNSFVESSPCNLNCLLDGLVKEHCGIVDAEIQYMDHLFNSSVESSPCNLNCLVDGLVKEHCGIVKADIQ